MFVMLGHDIFCCVYSEEVPEDGSLSGSEDVMASLSSNSGTFTEPVVLEVGSGHSQGLPARRGIISFHLFTP